MGELISSEDALGIILVDHGSRVAEANAMLDEVVACFVRETGAGIVEAAHMELVPPTIAEAFAKCVERGAKRIVVHPYFLAPGRHSTHDIPAMVREAAGNHPGIGYRVTKALGVDSRIAAVIEKRITEALDN